MTEISKLLYDFLQEMANEIIAKIPKASGETARSIEVLITEEEKDALYIISKAQLVGGKYIWATETGRGPTRSKKAGSPTLQESILSWIESKNLIPKVLKSQKGIAINAKEAQERMSWAMAAKIHNEGNKLLRKGGRSGVISNTVTDQRINNFMKIFTEKTSTYLLNNIKRQVL